MSLVRSRRVRGVVAIPSVLLTSVLVVVGPLLERSDVRTQPVVESEHDPGSCPAPHDHRLCTQANANPSAPAERSDATAFAPTHRTIPASSAPAVASTAALSTPPARAPPSS